MIARRWRVPAAALALAVGVGCPTRAPAAAAWDVAVGFAGRYRAGSWTPLVVSPTARATAAGDLVRVWVEDPDGSLVGSPPTRLVADAAGGLAARFLVRPGRPSARLVIEHGEPPARAELWLPEAVPSTRAVMLVIGDLPAAGRAARLLAAGDGQRIEVVPLAGPRAGGPAAIAAGEGARDYDSADMIVVCGSAVDDVPEPVLRGVDAWVRRGGRLVFLAGGSAREVHDHGGPAADWLPGPVAGMVPLRRMAAVESHARAGGLAARAVGGGPRVPVFANRGRIGGVIDVFEGGSAADLPLVVRSAHGLGTITWLGVDLDEEPLRGWPGSDTLLVRLLGGKSRDLESTRPLATAGPPDLAGQLRIAIESPWAARDPDAGHGPVPFALILGLGALYVAALYPLDWWLVSGGRATGSGDRSRIAWLTLPAIVLAFTAAAWALASRWRPTAASVATTAEVVDIDSATGAIRGSAWGMEWRADNAVTTVATVAPGRDGEAAVSWCADAGTGFGAIDAVVAHPPLAAADYGYGASLAELRGVAVAASSNRLFEADWSARVDPASVVASTLAQDANGTLRGKVAHRLPFPLHDCRLAHGGWEYEIGRLPPGDAYDVDSGRGPRSLAGALTRRTADREREVVDRWDVGSPDVARILLVAGFHAAAGGPAYTGLPAGRLARLDLSPLLAVDRAVLTGAAPAESPGTEAWSASWSFDPGSRPGAAGPRTAARLYRIVIPLTPALQAPGIAPPEQP